MKKQYFSILLLCLSYTLKAQIPIKSNTATTQASTVMGVKDSTLKVKLTLPFTKEAREYTVSKWKYYYIIDDMIVGNTLMKTRSISRDNGLLGWNYRWANGVIPVLISADVYKNGHGKVVHEAIEKINSLTKLYIVPKTNQEDFINITCEDIDAGGSSEIGRQGGEQWLYLNNDPTKIGIGTVMHELLHAAGFYHEQNREDRDKYIRINWDNIKSKHKHNFETIPTSNGSLSPSGDYQSPYDFCSIMHYSNRAFAINPNIPTIERVKPLDANQIDCMGSRELSEYDIRGIAQYYKNPNQPNKQPFPWPKYDFSGNNYNYLTGDFNGDGLTDVLHLANVNFLHVWLFKADGTYDIKERFPSTNDYHLQNDANYKFLTGDFNGDGLTDLVHIVNFNYLHVWISNGDGTFNIQSRFPATNGYSLKNDAGYHFSVGDFNGDGKSDLLHIVNNNYAHVWLSNGDGTFEIKTRFPATNGYALNNDAGYKFLIGDFNGDKKSDVVHIVNWNYLHVWLSKGDGTFTIQTRFPTTNGYSLKNDAGYNFSVGDFNGDGKSDLLHIVNNDYAHVWTSKGDGSFDIRPRFPAQNGYALKNDANYKFLIADVTGDGKTDMIHIVNEKYLHIWASNGDGSFQIQGAFPNNTYNMKNGGNYKFLVGNFNSDKKADLIHIVNRDYTHTWLTTQNGQFSIK